MDRYLYKAKRTDNGEWVTGSLITCGDGTCKIATSLLESKANEPILVCAYDVDRDTICQCTGLNMILNMKLSETFLAIQSY